MKTKFAHEKSHYANLLYKLLNLDVPIEENYNKIIGEIKQMEQTMKSKNDELIFIITTTETNPLKDRTAKPMNSKDIKIE